MNYLLTQELWNKLVSYLLSKPSEEVGDLVVELKALLVVNVVPQASNEPTNVQPADQTAEQVTQSVEEETNSETQSEQPVS